MYRVSLAPHDGIATRSPEPPPDNSGFDTREHGAMGDGGRKDCLMNGSGRRHARRGTALTYHDSEPLPDEVHCHKLQGNSSVCAPSKNPMFGQPDCPGQLSSGYHPSLLTATRTWIGSVQGLGPAVHTQDGTPNPEHAQCLWPLSPSCGAKRLLPRHSASAAPGTGQGPESVKGHSRCVSTWRTQACGCIT